MALNMSSLRPAAAQSEVYSIGLVTREQQPQNLEYPFATLDSLLIPNECFFVRCHFPEIPQMDTSAWRLKIEGAVERPFEIGYDELTQMSARTVSATLECAGNGRVFLTPKVGGVQWELGAVGTAEWTGVPLRDVLERAGVRDDAVEVVLEGADTGEIKEEPKSPGTISYARSLPLAKSRHSEVLLAYQMNGQPLPPEHGFPVRAIVPGWYGMASVKWLARVLVTPRPFSGYFQSADYSYWEKQDGQPIEMRPVTQVEVKAQIARPARLERIPADTDYHVYGAAWTGESEVTKVEVSMDAGQSWQEARLLGDAIPYTWRLWEYHWHTPSRPGKVTLMARATDARGCVQPMQRDERRGTYMISHVLPVEVEVR